MHELDTVYGVQDVYDLIEIETVNAHNRRVLAKRTRD